MYGYGYRYSIRPGYVPFNPLTDIDGLQLYLNKNTNVNTKVAADFVATNSEYLSSASTDFDKGNEDFSWGGWFKFDDTAIQRVLGQYGSIGNRAYIIYKDATNINLLIGHDGTTTIATIGSTYNTGTWYFVVAVYDSVNDLQKISVNGGNFDTTANALGSYSGGVADFEISNSDSIPFDGSADSPFFYDKALTLAEVKALYNSDNGVDYPSLTDLNGTQYAIGQSFDGSTDAFNIDSVLTPLASTTTGYWECIVTPVDATPTTSEIFISFGDTNTNELIDLYIQATTGYLVSLCKKAGVNQWSILTDVSPFSDGVACKVALKHDGTTPTLYVNDVAVAQSFIATLDKTAFISSLTNLDNVRIGCVDYNSGGNQFFFNGTIQNVKIWSDDTQTTQIAEWLMNDVEGANQTDSVGTYDATPIGTPISTLASVNNTTIATIESDLVDWWRLNETSGNRSGELGHTLTDNNTVGYALGKVQEVTENGELVWNWIDQSSNAFIFKNDTVTKQPLLSANSIDFDGTDDGLTKTVADALNDSSGIYFFSGYFDNSSNNYIFSTADQSIDNKYFVCEVQGATGKIRINCSDGVTNNVITSTNTISNGAYFYGYIKSTGTAYEINLDGIIESLIIILGSDDGMFPGDITGRDSLTVGWLDRLSPIYTFAKPNKIIYSNDYTIDTTPILNFLSNPDN